MKAGLPMVGCMPLRRSAAIVALTVCALASVAFAAAPVEAQTDPPARFGQVTLSKSPGVPGFTFRYTVCGGQRFQVRGHVTAFDNRPLPECKVTLAGSTIAQRFDLCIGRGRIPTAFQDSPLALVQRGKSVPCSPITSH